MFLRRLYRRPAVVYLNLFSVRNLIYCLGHGTVVKCRGPWDNGLTRLLDTCMGAPAQALHDPTRPDQSLGGGVVAVQCLTACMSLRMQQLTRGTSNGFGGSSQRLLYVIMRSCKSRLGELTLDPPEQVAMPLVWSRLMT